jgi:HEPN domain-containing protein
MSLHHRDWMRPARRDIDHALRSLPSGDDEWACFAAQRVGEKAVYQKLGADACGRSVTALLQSLPSDLQPPIDPLTDSVPNS